MLRDRRTHAGWWLGLVLFLLVSTSRGEDAALEDLVAELDHRITAVECENQQLRRLLKSQGVLSRYEQFTNGRIHVDYWAYPGDSPGVNAFESGSELISPQDRFQIRRARIEQHGELPGSMFYHLDIELSEASKPEFRDVLIGWEDLSIIGNLKFGNQKRPYGLDHLNSSNFNVMVERPFVNQAFNRNNRRFGLASYHCSDNEAWNWRYGVFNLQEIQTDGAYVSDHYQLELAGRLAHTFYDPYDESCYIHTAVASNYARPDGTPMPGREENQAQFRTEPEARTNSQWLDTGVIHGAQWYSLLGVEGVVNYHRLQVTGEYMNLWSDRAAGFGDSLHFHGGYLQLSWFLTEHYQPWQRDLGTIGRVEMLGSDRHNHRCWRPALQAAVRWSFADLTDSDIAGGVGESVSAGLSWYWTDRSRFQFNCSYGEISDHRPVDGHTFGHYVALGTRVMVDF